MTDSSLHKQIEEMLKDYNGFDFCGEKACSGQAKATELISELLQICDRIAIESRNKLADEVGKMMEIQGVDGTWNYDPYMHGMYNGMEFCHSLIKGVEPKYREAPDKWLSELNERNKV